MHMIDVTVLVMLATILVAFERTGLAAIVGGIGFRLVARSMRRGRQAPKSGSSDGNAGK